MAPEIGTLDLKLSVNRSINHFTKEASSIPDPQNKLSKLRDYVATLEDERRKIEVFKRELPLCMFIINEVIVGIKDEIEQCQSDRSVVVEEEFMPVKKCNNELDKGESVKVEKDCKDKMNWMSSAQLWSGDDDNNKNTNKVPQEVSGESDHRQNREAPSLESKRGAFVPFKGLAKKEDKVTVALPDLSLVSPPTPKPSLTVSVASADQCKVIGKGHVSSPRDSHVSVIQTQQQTARKARRCWSPELHRRFVVALQQLGGAQVATPKQIRELMKVDGLTNDEVKSHLQKYRLHSRRAPNSTSSVSLWAQDHYTSSQHSGSQSGSPQGPFQLAGSTRAISVTAGDSCEEGKSESYSWK